MEYLKNIRNFAIIAHIDHGKSTLADRLLELTHTVEAGKHDEQMLDRNPISRERGITIKLAPVRMKYVSASSDGKSLHSSNLRIDDTSREILELSTQTEYTLNLIDTPGHVDFSYEVDRTLACVEGVILLVDATQGIQAQTIANAYKAIEKNLVIIPVINKIDLPNAEVEKSKQQLVDFLGVRHDEIYEISAKTGKGVAAILDAVIQKIPPPLLQHEQSPSNETAQALIFDSYYDTHRGVIAFVRVFDGLLKKNMKVSLAASHIEFVVNEVGIFTPELTQKNSLNTGQIGYVVTNLKDIHDVAVGDTISTDKTTTHSYPGYKKIKPLVFAAMFPTDTNDYLNLKKSLEKLYLNDSSLEFSAIYSQALGAGFRVGFLGLLHADVVRERLEREFNLSLILTPPQVEFRYENDKYMEPWVKIMLLAPHEYLGAVMQLCESYRARFITMDNKNQISIAYEMPLSEMISEFFDNLKSVTSGYASFDWEFLRYEEVEADKLIILLNDGEVDEFSQVVVKERSIEKAMQLTKKLKDVIPRQQFEIKIQAKYKGKIIAAERISAFRKDVTAKLYGGDRTRKDKLLEKQKEGKKRMKMIGSVEVPKEAFLQLFKKS
jgi:GTP-binding protein LepA